MKNRTLTCSLLIAFASLVPAALSAQKAQGDATFEFHATSTLKNVSGTAVAESVALILTPTPDGSLLSGTITVAVASMNTRHPKRDENMRKMFDAPQYPLITGILSPFPIPIADEATIPLLLTIRDKTTTVSARLHNGQGEGDAYSFHLDMDLSLQAIGLSPPVFLGMLRVGDEVQVRGRVSIGQTPENAP